MKKIIITFLLIVGYTIGADRPTHYINGKWRVCDEMSNHTYGPVVINEKNHIEPFKIEYNSKGNKECYYNTSWNDDYYMIEYNSKGNRVYEKDFYADGKTRMEAWFDSKGNEIHIKSNGYEWWNEYDSYSNLLHKISIDRNGIRSDKWYEYFTANGEKINSTYDYDKENTNHVLKCVKE